MISRDRLYSQLAGLALGDFADIVEGTRVVEGKLRLFLKDRSFLISGFRQRKKESMPITGREEMWMGRSIDITICRIERQKGLKPTQDISTIGQRKTF